jgi:hypothetical protein
MQRSGGRRRLLRTACSTARRGIGHNRSYALSARGRLLQPAAVTNMLASPRSQASLAGLSERLPCPHLDPPFLLQCSLHSFRQQRHSVEEAVASHLIVPGRARKVSEAEISHHSLWTCEDHLEVEGRARVQSPETHLGKVQSSWSHLMR